MGYVYLILQIDEKGLEKHKIGFTKNNPELRVKQLSTGNPNQIRLLDFYESQNYIKVEKMLHNKYFSLKTISDNEWFNLTQETILEFKEECKKFDAIIKLLKESNAFYK